MLNFALLCENFSDEFPDTTGMRIAVDAHRVGLLRLFGKQGFRGPDAEDIAQEAFFVLARRLADVSPVL